MLMNMATKVKSYTSPKGAATLNLQGMLLSEEVLAALEAYFSVLSGTKQDVSISLNDGELILKMRGSISLDDSENVQYSLIQGKAKALFPLLWEKELQKIIAFWQGMEFNASWGAVKHQLMQRSRGASSRSFKAKDQAEKLSWECVSEKLSQKETVKEILNMIGKFTSVSVNTWQFLPGGRIRITVK